MSLIRVRAGEEVFHVKIVGADQNPKPNWYDVRFVDANGKEGHALVRFTLRRNGRYVVVGADRDTGSYMDEGDLR